MEGRRREGRGRGRRTSQLLEGRRIGGGGGAQRRRLLLILEGGERGRGKVGEGQG